MQIKLVVVVVVEREVKKMCNKDYLGIEYIYAILKYLSQVIWKSAKLAQEG